MIRLALVLIGCLMGAGASATPADDMKSAVSEVQTFVKKSGHRPLKVEFANSFGLLCPLGLICPSKEEPMLLRSQRGSEFFMLGFSKLALSDLSLKSLRATFEYADFALDLSKEIPLPKFKVTTFFGDTLVRKDSKTGQCHLRSADAGVLKGSLTTTIKQLQISRDDQWAKDNCNVQDGDQPKGCIAYVDAPKPVHIQFAIQLPTQPKDCRKAGVNTPGCG